MIKFHFYFYFYFFAGIFIPFVDKDDEDIENPKKSNKTNPFDD